jgi:hypothetical protein
MMNAANRKRGRVLGAGEESCNAVVDTALWSGRFRLYVVWASNLQTGDAL